MRRIILVCMLAAAFAAAEAPSISWIGPRSGSINGGTRLTISGQGFDERGRSNDVYIGNSEEGAFCDPIPNECHSKRIVCLTDKFDGRGEYQISVRSHGTAAQCNERYGCKFKFSLDQTPNVYSVSPEWLATPNEVTVSGRRFSQGDATVGAFDFTMHIGDEERCDLDGNTVGWSAYSCTVGSSVFAGTQPIKVQMGALGDADSSAITQLDIYPQINSVLPNTGSTRGGQKITVYGTAFSRFLVENEVTVHGAPCGVTFTDNDRLECITSAHAATTTPADTWETGKVQVDWWTGRITYPDYTVARGIRSMAYNQPDGTATVSAFGAGAPYSAESYMLARWTTHFVAPQDGEYTFEVRGDDNVELWLAEDEHEVEYKRTAVVIEDPWNAARIAHHRYASSSNWTKYSSQKSEKLTLAAGKKYWMRAYLANAGGSFWFNTRVTLPDGTVVTNPKDNLVAKRTFATTPVKVTVRNVSAINSNECIVNSSDCDFNFVAASTPTVTSVTASANAGDSITIVGSAFSANSLENTVTIGTSACPVTSSSTTSIVCTVGSDLSAGKYVVAVHVQGKGRSAGSSSVTIGVVLSGASNQGSTLTVTGSGFGSDVNTVVSTDINSAGAQTATLSSTTSTSVAGAVTASAGGSSTAAVSVDNVAFAGMPSAFTYLSAIIRPGTTTTPGAASRSPSSGSAAGGTVVTIVIPAWTFADASSLSVTIGTTSALITHAWGSRLVIRTPTASAAGTFNITVTRGSDSVVVGTFTYYYSISNVHPTNLSPKGGNRVYLDFNSIPSQMRVEDLSVAFEGQSCTDLAVHDNYMACILPTIDSTTSVPATPVLASYNSATANVLNNFYTNQVTITNAGFRIAAGGWLMTRKKFGRPTVFKAKVRTAVDGFKSNSESCVRMAALVADRSTTYQGWFAEGGIQKDGKYFSIRRDGHRYGGQADTTPGEAALSGSSFSNWRLELWHSLAKFYVNDELVDIVTSTQFTRGEFGFAHSCQDIVVQDLVVENLQPRDLQVNISGVPARVAESVYIQASPAFKLTGISKNNAKPGETITFQGSPLWKSGHRNRDLRVYAMSSTTEQRSFSSLDICESKGAGTDGMFSCKIRKDIAAGDYTLRVANYNGFAEKTFDFTINPVVTAVSPLTSGTAGTTLTVSGGGFSNTASDVTVTVGGATCEILYARTDAIQCKVPAGTATTNQAIVVKRGTATVSFSCTGCNQFKYDASLTPTITGLYLKDRFDNTVTTFTDNSIAVYIQGNKLGGSGEARIGGKICRRSWSSSSTFKCYFYGEAPSAGNHDILLYSANEKSYAAVTGTVQLAVANGVSTIYNGGATTGSTIILAGLGFSTSTGMTNLRSATYTSGAKNNHWSVSNTETTKRYSSCASTMGSMFGGHNTFSISFGSVVSQSFTAIATHSYLRFKADIAILNGWGSSETFSVSVDGVTRTYNNTQYVCPYGQDYACGDKYSDCYLTVDFVIPHTASTATIALFGNGHYSKSERSFGIRSYRVQTATSGHYAATVDGSSCAITAVTPTSVECTAPSHAEGDVTVALTAGGSAVNCVDCTFNYNASRTPTVSAVTFGTLANVAVNGSLTWTTGKNVRVNADNSLEKVSGGHSWNAGARSKELYFRDSGLQKVSFQVTAGDYLMFGFTSAALDRSQYYRDLDHAFYLPGDGSWRVYENGDHADYIGTHVSRTATADLVIDYKLNAVQFFLNGFLVHTSRKNINWPLRVDCSMVEVNTTLTATPILNVSADSRIPVVLSGSNLPADRASTVTIDGSAVPVVHSTNGHLTVAVSGTTAAALNGASKTVVTTNYLGSSVSGSFTVKPFIASLSHSTGSTNGRHQVTINGGGFYAAPTVTFAGAAATVVSYTYDQIKVLTPAAAAGDAVIVVTVNSVAADCVSAGDQEHVAETTNVCPTYLYNASYAYAATASPTTVAAGDSLTVTGSGFPIYAAAAGETAPVVVLGQGTECAVTAATTSTSITCTVASVTVAGAYTDAYVHFPATGASASFSVTVSLVASVTASTGSLGGAKITFSGSGFGSASSTALTVTASSSAVCSAITRAAGSFVCTVNAGTFASPLTVGINGVTASVSGFDAAASHNPTLTAATTTPVAIGDTVTLTGTNLDGTLTVTVGTASCAVTAQSSTSVSCVVEGALSEGSNTVALVSSTRGTASGSVSVTAALQVTGVSPRVALPGATVTIKGSGFSTTNSRLKVSVGGLDCAVSASTAGTITCTAPTPSAVSDTVQAVTVRDFFGGQTVSSSFSYTFNYVAPATVSSISPTSGSAAGGDVVTLTGTNFDLTAANNKVTINNVKCEVIEVTATTTLICRTGPNTQTGSVSVAIYDTVSTGSVTFTTSLAISAIDVAGSSTKQVSVEGGVRITLTGTGFPPVVHPKVSVDIGGNDCTNIATTTTTVECDLPPNRRTRSEIVTLLNAYPMRGEGVQHIVLKINDTIATVDNSTIYVEYKQSVTPTITALSQNVDVLTITGTGFASSGNKVWASQIRFNGGRSNCVISAESTTSITCTLNVSTYGKHFVSVNVPQIGKTHASFSCPSGQFLMCDGSCKAESQCNKEEWGAFGCQDITTLIAHDTFCHSNGGTDRVNKPLRTDSNDEFNLNCPMYSCEGNDCDTTVTIGGRGGRVSTCGVDPDGYTADIVPTVTAVSTKTSSINGGQRVTITGTHLTKNAIVRIGSAGSCTVLSATSTSLVCETAAHAAATGLVVALYEQTIQATCGVCTGFAFETSSTPTLTTDFSPKDSRGRLLAYGEVTLAGTGFSTTTSDNIVTLGGSNCVVTAATATSLTCTTGASTVGYTNYPIVRVVGKGIASVPSGSNRVRIMPFVASLSVQESSQAGGQVVTVTGRGFYPKVANVAVRAGGGCWFKVTNATTTVIIAETYGCTSSSAQVVRVAANGWWSPSSCTGTTCDMLYRADKTPSYSTSVSGTSVTITASSTDSLRGTSASDYTVKAGSATCAISSADANSISCTLGSSHAAGTYPIVLTLNNFGYGWTTATYTTYPLTVTSFTPSTGSLAGGQAVTITGDGFADDAAHQNVTIAGVDCNVTSVSRTQIVCTTGASAATSAVVNVTVIPAVSGVDAVAQTSSASYTYSGASTPTITAVSPNRGSTAGGTALTITGTGLDNLNGFEVEGVACTQTSGQTSSSSATTYYCTTAASKTSLNPQTVRGTTASLGDALVSTGVNYQYIDLWSRWTTWGNKAPPASGDSAVISEGQAIMLDYSPPRLHLIIVMGHLIFDNNVDLTLEATYIMINFGKLTIGTPETPYAKKATIRLYGTRLTPEIPVHGSKVLALRHGALDIHGTPRKAWTMLAATAAAETNQIQVRGPVDWVAGETIAVASTDYKMEHAEKRKIAAVANTGSDVATITLDEPLHYQHYGERQCFGDTNPVCVDEIAEVILLSRNIVLEGDADSKTLGFGGTMFLMPMGESETRYARLSHMEFRDVGQQYIVGRYPVHYHITGNARNSYCNGTAVHGSLNRAFSIHGVNYNTYVNNVVYDIQGHAFFIEDGSEKHNVIADNVAMLVHSSTSNLNTDVTPANFWVVSPTNTLTGNHACGGAAYGFWISPFHPHSTGPTHSTSDCPTSDPLEKFANNIAHSNKKYGLNIFKDWWPKSQNCNRGSPDQQAVIENHLSYKNKIHGITSAHDDMGEIGAVVFNNYTGADNGELHTDGSNFWLDNKVNAENHTMGIQNSIIIALTNNQPHNRRLKRRGINFPKHDNIFAKNITFVNYQNENFAFEPQAWAARRSFCFPWGWEAVISGIRYINSPNKFIFRFVHHGTFNDVDGTVGGKVGSQIVPAAPIYDTTKCTPISGSSRVQALACDHDYKVRRFGVSTFENGAYHDVPWTIEGRTEDVIEIKHKYSIVAPVRKMIDIDFNHAFNPDFWEWKLSTRYMADDEHVGFKTFYKYPKHTVNASFKTNGRTKMGEYVHAPIPDVLPAAGPNNTYHFTGTGGTNGSLTAMMIRPATQIQVTAAACPPEGCPAPPAAPPAVSKACESFDAASSWASGAVPDTDVHVTYQDSVCLDRPSGIYNFGKLLVEGTINVTNAMCPSSGVIQINIARFAHVRGGNFHIGSASDPLTACKVNISIGVVDYTQVNNHIQLPWTTRSLIVENGELEFFGAKPTPLFTRLTATAAAQSTTLTVEDDVNWKAGDYIGIASTQKESIFTKDPARTEQSEYAKIVSVSGKTITLSKPLAFSHYGSAPKTINGVSHKIGAEVAVLSRNIEINGGHGLDEAIQYGAGWQLNVGCTEKNTKGCGVGDLDSNGWPMSSAKTASFKLDAVALRDIGQHAVRHAGVEIDGLISPENKADALGSFIKNSAIWRSWNDAITIRDTTSNFTLEANTIFDINGDAIRVSSSGNVIDSNLAILQRVPQPQCAEAYFVTGTEDCRGGMYRIFRGNRVVNNIAASSVVAGYLVDGDHCTGGPASHWEGNIAHSTRDGILVHDTPFDADYNWAKGTYTCRKVRGVTAYSIADQGVIAWYVTGDLEVSDVNIIDASVGYAGVLMTAETDDGTVTPTVKISNSAFAGYWPGDVCRNADTFQCRNTKVNFKPWCEAFYDTPTSITASDYKIGNIGIFETAFVSPEISARTKGEHKFMWMEPDSYATIKGRVTIDNVHFDNFAGVQSSCNSRSHAFMNNIFSNDTFHQHVFSNINWGSGVQNGGEYYARTMYGEATGFLSDGKQATWLDFDDGKFGAYWPDAPNKFFIVDADGTFTRTGSKTTVIGSQSMVRNQQFTSYSWDGQWGNQIKSRDGIIDGCTATPNHNTFTCNKEYISISFESLADDRLTRRYGPFVLCKGDGMINEAGRPLCQGGEVDFASGPVMKGKTQRATLDRLTRYRFIAENGGNYTLYSRGQPPTWMRFWVDNHQYLAKELSEIGVTLNLRYFGLNAEARVGAYVNGRRQRTSFGIDYPWNMVPAKTWPAPTDPAGTHFHNKLRRPDLAVNTMYFTVRPDSYLDLKQEPIVIINMDVSMPFDEFFNQKDTFAAALAQVLGISGDRIHFAEIVPGTNRRRAGAGETAATVEIDQDTDALNAAQASGTTTSAADLAGVVTSVNALQNDPDAIARAANVSGFTVSGITVKTVGVIVEAQPVKMADGVSYMLVNVTRNDGLAFNYDEVRSSLHSHSQSLSTVLSNVTLDEVIVANVYTDKNNYTRFTISYVLENYDQNTSNTQLTFLDKNWAGALPAPYTVLSRAFITNVNATNTTNGTTEGSGSGSGGDGRTTVRGSNSRTTVIFAVAIAAGLFVVLVIGFVIIFYVVRANSKKKKTKGSADVPTSRNQAQFDENYIGEENENDVSEDVAAKPAFTPMSPNSPV